MNKVQLMGRLARDVELQQTLNNVAVAKFTIAVSRRFAKEGQQQADFINCVAWRATAEFISKYFRKGSMIAVVGSIQTRTWDGQDGQKKYATEVIIEEAYFTGSKSESGTYDNNSQPTQVQQNDFNPQGFDSFEVTQPPFDTDDDLPF